MLSTIPESKKPFFSLVIPTHNRSKLLTRAIKSCLQQTFLNFEIIVVDDGSMDNTSNAVASFKDSRIRYFRNSQSRGVSAARNQGIRQAKASYIAFLDDDDEYHPEFLEHTASTITNSDTEIDFTWCGSKVIFEIHDQNACKEILIRKPRPEDSTNDFAIHFAVSQGFMASKKSLLEIGMFDESLTVSEDADLLFRLLAHKFEYKAIPEVLINVYIHTSQSLSRSTDHCRNAACNQKLIDKNRVFLENHSNLWIHYHNTLAADYYRSGEAIKARKIIYSILKRYPWRLATWEKLLRFEVKQRLFQTK